MSLRSLCSLAWILVLGGAPAWGLGGTSTLADRLAQLEQRLTGLERQQRAEVQALKSRLDQGQVDPSLPAVTDLQLQVAQLAADLQQTRAVVDSNAVAAPLSDLTAELRAVIGQLRELTDRNASPPAPPASAAPAPAPAVIPAAPAAAPVAEPVRRTVELAGYVKLDLAYDSAPPSHGNYMIWATQKGPAKQSHTLNVTARQTRLTLNLRQEKMTGRVEADFYGGGAENKNSLLLRHAYVAVALGGVTLQAGQMSDMISPLVPATINYTVAWGSGNVGYRRPQLQLLRQGTNLAWGLSVGRSIGADLNNDQLVDGEASALPVVQARIAGTAKSATTAATVGLSGHLGTMEAPGAAIDEYRTWSANLDLKVQFTPGVSLLGETYTGVNTGPYMGAILNTDTAHELRSLGGWANLQLKLPPRGTVSLGGGIDDLRNETHTALAAAANARTRNRFIFANYQHQLIPSAIVGFEVSHWATRYANPGAGYHRDASDLRVQCSLQGSI